MGGRVRGSGWGGARGDLGEGRVGEGEAGSGLENWLGNANKSNKGHRMGRMWRRVAGPPGKTDLQWRRSVGSGHRGMAVAAIGPLVTVLEEGTRGQSPTDRYQAGLGIPLGMVQGCS